MRVLLIAAIAAALSVPARSECLSSASAVWVVHPGSHPNWRLRLPGHVGEKCWYAKNSTNLPAPQVQESRVQDSPRRTESDPRADGQTKRVSSEVKAVTATVTPSSNNPPKVHVGADYDLVLTDRPSGVRLSG